MANTPINCVIIIITLLFPALSVKVQFKNQNITMNQIMQPNLINFLHSRKVEKFVD